MRGPTIGVLAVLVMMTRAAGRSVRVAGTGRVADADHRGAGPRPPDRRPPCRRSHATASLTTAIARPPRSPTTASSAPELPRRGPGPAVLGRGRRAVPSLSRPLDEPDDVTVEGRVSGSQAWSTSKVLVAAAFLETTADGDPDAASAANRRLIAAALQSSDADAVRSLRQQIPGRPGGP